MIQVNTSLNVIDNCGAKKAYCIKVSKGYRRRYSYIGDIILVVIQNIRSKRKLTSKVKKGDLYNALVVRTKFQKKNLSGNTIKFIENSVVILNKQKRLIGTKIFGAIPKHFRFTKFTRLISLSSGILS
jgi:large subunit ribosomal protein L14